MKNIALEKLISQGVLWRSGLLQRSGTFSFGASFGIEEIDGLFSSGGLASGAMHQWLTDEQAARVWFPPFLLLGQIVRNSLLAQQDKWVFWIGRRCWFSPYLLPEFLERIVFLDVSSREQRVWCASQVLACPAALACIVDGSGFREVDIRRLRLAASAGQTLGIFCQNSRQALETAVADTRWSFAPLSSGNWELKLLRARGLLQEQRWILECQDNEEQGCRFSLSANAASRAFRETKEARGSDRLGQALLASA